MAPGLSSTGGQTFALDNLPGSSPVLYAQDWINVASHSSLVTLFGVRTQATPTTAASHVAEVYLDASGTIKVLNNVTKASYLSKATVATGSWHKVTFVVNETAGTLQVWLDGTGSSPVRHPHGVEHSGRQSKPWQHTDEQFPAR